MTFPPSFDPAEAEPRLQATWEAAGLHHFDPDDPRPIFAIDTPPPTVSGELHLGHVYSYVQAEAMIRFWRMQGYNVFYPFGFDDNGLPTERYVERSRGIRAVEVGRAAFIEACLAASAEAEARFEQFWRRLGFSADWRHSYSTIDHAARRTAQWSFLDLYRRGRIYRAAAPNPWCPECATAVAQAELEETPEGRRVHERCGTPLEIRTTSQWFVRLLDAKDELIAAGRQLTWRPAFMQGRYERWVADLSYDWCISRQRFFGVPFPVWHCRGCGATLLADEAQLPIDPATTPAPGPCACGSRDLAAAEEVMDTWFTSSLTPQIAGRLLEAPALYQRVFPMELRPQAHDIIRTWTFYTIVKSHFHFGALPWRTVMLSGHALDPAGRKLDKKRGGGATAPAALIERYGADAVRYWACRASLGADQPLAEETMRQGRRLVAKLWNAARLCAPHLRDEPASAPMTLTDRWLLATLQRTIAEATERWHAYDYAAALELAERFFWSTFCDQYLELVKARLYDGDEAGRSSARATMAIACAAILKLFAPVLPHIADELYGLLYPGQGSLHAAAWPAADPAYADPAAEAAGTAMLAIVAAVRRHKTAAGRSLGAPLAGLTIACADPGLRGALAEAATDLAGVARAARLAWANDPPPDATELAPGLWLAIAP